MQTVIYGELNRKYDLVCFTIWNSFILRLPPIRCCVLLLSVHFSSLFSVSFQNSSDFLRLLSESRLVMMSQKIHEIRSCKLECWKGSRDWKMYIHTEWYFRLSFMRRERGESGIEEDPTTIIDRMKRLCTFIRICILYLYRNIEHKMEKSNPLFTLK